MWRPYLETTAAAVLSAATDVGSIRTINPALLKNNLTQRRFRAPKKRAHDLCKPHTRGWEDKKWAGKMGVAGKHAHEMREQGFPGLSEAMIKGLENSNT